jgi:hypothetical protein
VVASSVRSVRSPLTSVALGVVCLLLGACASQRPTGDVERTLDRALSAAHAKHEAGLDAEAAALVHAIAAVDDRLPGMAELRQGLDADARARMQRGWLGMNRKLRPHVRRPIVHRVALYIADRVLDLFDVLSFDVMYGGGAFLDYHATRAIQAAGGVRAASGLGWHDYRSLGIQSQADAGLTVVAVGALTHVGALVGTSGARGAAADLVGMHRPSDPLYQEIRDYWAIGGGGTVGVMGAEIDFHPLQLADFLAGLVGIDFLNDDFATTRGLRFDSRERKLLQQLATLRASEKALLAYREAKRAGAEPSPSDGDAATDPTATRPSPDASPPASPPPE